MRILYDNKIDDYSLSASTYDPNYTASNLQDTRLAVPWRSTALTAQTIVLDAAAAMSCDSVAIAGHNLTASATVKIQAATADSWGSPSIDATMTYRDGIMVYFCTSASYRYWRFYFDDQTNTDGYIEVGRLFLGEYLQFDPSSLSDFPEESKRTDAIQFSPGNQEYGDIGVGYKVYRYKYPKTANTMKGYIDTVFNTVGKHTPVFFMNFDTTYTVIPPIYCIIEDDIVFDSIGHSEWEYGLTFREVG